MLLNQFGITKFMSRYLDHIKSEVNYWKSKDENEIFSLRRLLNFLREDVPHLLEKYEALYNADLEEGINRVGEKLKSESWK